MPSTANPAEKKRAPVGIDIAAFAPKPVPGKGELKEIAKQTGFTTTHARETVAAPPHVEDDAEVYDARIRRGPKVKMCGLNTTVPVSVRNRFWQLRDEMGFQSGAEVLDYLLGLHEERR